MMKKYLEPNTQLVEIHHITPLCLIGGSPEVGGDYNVIGYEPSDNPAD